MLNVQFYSDEKAVLCNVWLGEWWEEGNNMIVIESLNLIFSDFFEDFYVEHYC